MNPVKDVKYFQENVLGNTFPSKPGFSKELIDETIVNLKEELEEFEDAKTIEDQADALMDGIYFAFGALHQAGIDADRVWAEIQRANCDKFRGKTKRGRENDAAKPADWRGPDHSWLSEAAE